MGIRIRRDAASSNVVVTLRRGYDANTPLVDNLNNLLRVLV